VGPDTEEPRLLLLQVHYSGPAQQKVWIDPQQMRLVRCELYEGGDLIQRFTVSQVKENTGLKDSFFSF
jgi:outer membrane lipoprotein-sorting protein